MGVNEIIKCLLELEDKKDNIKYHEEKNVLVHSLQAFNHAKKETEDVELHMAALFHDIGKAVHNDGHPEIGVRMLEELGYRNNKVLTIIDNHMRIRWYLSGRLKKQSKIDRLLGNTYFNEIVQMRRFDKLGRNPDIVPEPNLDEIKQLIVTTSTVPFIHK